VSRREIGLTGLRDLHWILGVLEFCRKTNKYNSSQKSSRTLSDGMLILGEFCPPANSNAIKVNCFNNPFLFTLSFLHLFSFHWGNQISSSFRKCE